MMSMSVETWLVVAVILLAVAAAIYYTVDKNKDEFKKKQHKKLVSERMSVAKKRAENKIIKEKLMAKKAMKTTMSIASPRLSPAALKIKEQMKNRARHFNNKVIQENKQKMNVENFRRKEKMTKPYHKETPLNEIYSDMKHHTVSQDYVFTNDHITPTYGGVKKFAGHGQSDGDHIRGDVEVVGKGVFPGQSPQHSTLGFKKGFMNY